MTRSRFSLHAWLLLLPALLLLILFTHYPTVATVVSSFYTTPKGARPAVFVGLENFEVMAEDPIFWQVLWNNLFFAAGTIPASIVLAIVMALIVNAAIPGRPFLRMAFFTPTVLPVVAVANIWMFFYTPDYGLIDQLLKPFGVHGINWLGSQETVMSCLIVMMVWKEAGFFMIFYLAALQNIPPELEEAARIEGASRWYFFRRVVFPLLMPTTLFVLINAVINSFRLVDHLVVMTRGGPDNASALLLYYIFQVGFSFWDTAYAATLSVVLLALLFALSALQFFSFERRVHYR